MHAMKLRREAGVALVTALIVLIILTLLGVAALRASRLELRISNNAQSQLSALQQAQSVSDAMVFTASNFTILPGSDYYLCFTAASPYAPVNPTASSPYAQTPFSSSGGCLSSYIANGITYTSIGTLSLPAFTNGGGVVNPLPNNAYAAAIRIDPAFTPASSVRNAETSGRNYDFASFFIIAGYDATKPVDGSGNATSATQPAAGSSEVDQGLYVRHVKATGVTYQ